MADSSSCQSLPTRNLRPHRSADPPRADAVGEPDSPANLPDAGPVEEWCQELRRRWQAGSRVAIESLLVEQPSLVNDPEAVFELLYTEFLLRHESGQEPDLAEFLARFPSHGPRLEKRLRLCRLIGKGESSKSSPILPEIPITPDVPTVRPGPGGNQREKDDAPTLTLTGDQRHIGEYEILEELGRGGMGVVYRARHRDLGRIVALKMVLGARFASVEGLLRFRLEGEAAASLQHPNIVQVFEVGSHEDQPYIVLEFVEGGTLSRRLREGTLDQAKAAHLIEILARAVHFAHVHGIVHRDLKPSNILLGPLGTDTMLGLGQPKITDFGLAKQLDRAEGLTETGRILGTPEYMAPEQAAGHSRQIGPPTDVYALGAILYELLAGRPPFVSTATMDTMLQLLSREPEPIRRVEGRVSRDLETICLKCLEKEPARRYASAVDLAEDLRRYREGKPIQARPVGPLERIWKWARRRPVVAILTACLVLVTLLGFAGVSAALVYALEGWTQADAQRDRADEERIVADAERDKARDAERKEGLARRKAEDAFDQADRDRKLAQTNVAYNRLARALLEWRQNNLSGSNALLSQIDPDRRGWEWRYLRGLHDGELLHVSRPRQNVVLGLSFSPDGKELAASGGNPYAQDAAGSYPAEVAIWEVPSGKLLRSLTSFRHIVPHLAHSPDGKYLVAGSQDTVIRLWERKSGKLIREFQGGLGHIRKVALSPDGKTLYAACQQGGLHCWDLQTGKALPAPQPVTGDNAAVAVSPDGRYLASSSGRVRVWERATGKLLHTLEHGAADLVFRGDGRRLACADLGMIRLYSLPDGRELRSMTGHDGHVSSISFSPDGQLLASGGADTTVRVWDVEAGVERTTWRGHLNRVEAVAFHPDGWMLASSGAQPGDVRLWDLTRTQQSLSIGEPSPNVWIEALALDPSGQTVLTQRRGGLVEVRDAASGRLHFTRSFPITGTWRVPGTLAAFSGDARLLAGLRSDAEEVCVWEARSGRRLPGSHRHQLEVWQVAASYDGALVASGAVGVRDGELTSELAVWESVTGAARLVREDVDARCTSLTLSRDGKRLARCLVLLGGVVDAKGRRNLKPIGSVLEVWDVPSSARTAPTMPRLSIRLKESHLVGLAFSRDGTLLAGAMANGNPRLWQIPSGQPLHGDSLVGTSSLEGLAFSPDGKRLAGVSRAEVQVWDLDEGQEVLRLRPLRPRSMDGGFSPRVTWSPDGQNLAATNWEQTVSLWESGDRSTPEGKARLRETALARLPRWHLENARQAWDRNQPEVTRFHLARLERLGPLAPGWRLARGDLHARMGEWNKARADHLETMRLRADHSGGVWRKCLLLRAYLDDRAGLDGLVKDLLADATRTEDKRDLVLAAGTIPGLVPDPEELARLADDVIREDRRPAAHQFALGLAHLRARRPAEAIVPLNRALAPNRDWNQCHVHGWLALALAHQRLGEKAEARRWWTRARDWLEGERKKLDPERRPIPRGLGWEDWLTAQLLEREVRSVLGGT